MKEISSVPTRGLQIALTSDGARKFIGLSPLENRTRRIATVSAFAALYAALRFIPFSVVIGSPGAFFSFSDFLPLLYGILLGPYLGVLSVAIGTYVSFALARPPIFPEFLPFEFLPAAVNVLIVGFIFSQKKRNSILIFSLILLAFGLHPFTLHLVPISTFGTSITFPFYWLHLVAIVLLASPLVDKFVKRFRGKQTGTLLSGMILFAFIGTMSQHITGAFLTEISKGNIARVLDLQGFSALWRIVFVAYPFERAIITLASALLGAAVLRSLNTTFFKQDIETNKPHDDLRRNK